MRLINFEPILTPLKVIDFLFRAESGDSVSSQAVIDLIKSQTEGYSTIPWLLPETVPLAQHNQLVRIRGMIQDMPGTEPYAERFKISSESNTSWCYGRYRDRIESDANGELELNDDDTVLNDRHILVVTCTSPSQSDFLKSEVAQYASRQWQHLRDNSEVSADKDIKTSPHVIVKCYEQEFSAKLNDVYDFIGVLSLDSCVQHKQPAPMQTGQQTNFEFELPWYYREAMPTLHVIHAEKVVKSRDILRPFVITDDLPFKFNTEIRQRLLENLTYVLAGDRLAAEFLLCHLVSTIYGRSGAVVLGNLSLNICGIAPDAPATSSVVERACDLFHKILTHVEVIRVSIDELNKAPTENALDILPKFIPAETRLKRGRLQLPQGSHLVIDETTLEAGKLDENGIKVLAALGDIAVFQRMYYDFVYYQKEFDAEYNVCVFSDYKALVKCALTLPLVPSNPLPSAPVCEPVDYFQMAVLLAGIRDSVNDFELPAPMQETIANDFASIRKEMGGDAFTADDLSLMIVLARWLTISMGSRELTPEIWSKAKEMERERRARLSNFSKRTVDASK